jgi:TP901 family phage tail tape measure protein
MSSSLDFVIKLTDRATKPLKKVQAQIKAFNATAASSFKKIGGGSIALFAVAKSITGLLSPAEEMDRALKNASLGGVSSINELRTAAKKFSAEYGTSAIDFVNSASSIKGALSGISEADVPQAVAAMNMLSKATGESVDTSTAYIEQMAASYKGTVNKIGQLNFARHAAGIAAYAKNNFNVSTQQLQSMMQKTKGTAANNGVSMSEQAIVLSMASKSLGAGAAGSYAALYKNLGKAGKELGLSFADANGKMLSMPEIIAKIQGKFGKDLSKNIKAQEALDKALGAGSDIVKALAGNSDELNQHMKEIGKGQNFKLMQKMAQGNVKPLERINAQFMNIKESIGRALLPVLMPVMDTISQLIKRFARWLEMFPNIAKWIGIVAVGLLGFAGISAVISILSGSISMLIAVFNLFKFVVVSSIQILKLFRLTLVGISVAVKYVRSALIGLEMMTGIFTKLSKAVMLLFTPWGLIILGIIALVAIVWYFRDEIMAGIKWCINWIMQFWDSIKDTWIIQALIKGFQVLFDFVCGIWRGIGNAFVNVVEWLTNAWDSFIAFFTDFSFIDSFSKIGESLVKMFTNTWKTVKNMGIAVINTIIDGLNYIPGVNIELLEYEKIDAAEQSPVSTAKSPITSTLVRDIDHGGLSKEIQNSKSQNIDNSKNIQSVSIYNSQPMTPAQLQEWEQLYAG